MDMSKTFMCKGMFGHLDDRTIDSLRQEVAMGYERYFMLAYCLACCFGGVRPKNNLRIVKEWATLDFAFPNEPTRHSAIASGDYVPLNCVPIDVDVHHRRGSEKSRIFVTIPRFDTGRPVTLGIVQPDGRIAAYPDYSWNASPGLNCDGLTSVFRVAIDKCNRLWVMDTGKIGETQRCPPQLLAFNLENDQLLYRYKVPEASHLETSLFVTPVVDTRQQDCRDTFVYVADVTGYGLLVVDVYRSRSWRISHRLFYPFPSRGSFTIDGESFDLMDGVIGMALSPLHRGENNDRYMYFHALASTTENVVKTSLLRNDSFIEDSLADPDSMKVFAQERPSQSAAEAIDDNGIMYFGIMNPPSIYCWNTATEFSPKNFHEIAMNRETLQFASGIKIVNNLKGEQELWILTSSFQRVMTGSLNDSKVNFRIHAERIPFLMKNHPCSNPHKNPSSGYQSNLVFPMPEPSHKHHGSHRYGIVSYL